MLKYVDTKIVFREVPDEITLCINISNCPCHCKGCHSPYLAEDIGTVLDESKLNRLIQSNNGITCIGFMGGDNDPLLINSFAEYIKIYYEGLKVAWYSGKQELSKSIDLRYFDFIKLGPYKEECGPLTSKTTNQRFYKVINNKLINITKKFWKHETKN